MRTLLKVVLVAASAAILTTLLLMTRCGLGTALLARDKRDNEPKQCEENGEGVELNELRLKRDGCFEIVEWSRTFQILSSATGLYLLPAIIFIEFYLLTNDLLART